MTEIYKERKTCRSCGHSGLQPIFSLGNQYIINFPEGSSTGAGLRAPVDAVLCANAPCSLVQLKHTVDPDILYRQFWYKSGINETMRNALADITREAKERVPLQAGDIVIDIGTNDATLLRAYGVPGLVTVGFEPAVNLIAEASVGTTRIINDYFNRESFEKGYPGKRAKVVTSIAMFYDLEEPRRFVEDIKAVLAGDGIWINQMNYLRSMLEQNAFDNVSHEHLEYYSLSSLEYLLEGMDLEVFDVGLNDLNGGSFRAFTARRGAFPVSERVPALRRAETHLCRKETYDAFAGRLSSLRKRARDFIAGELEKGKRVYAYGASTRGNTLLQYFGLDQNWITAAAERNPVKFGKKMVGTNIPIISEEQARREKPDYFLVLPWAFVKEFEAREQTFLREGGKFIVPLPEFRVI